MRNSPAQNMPPGAEAENQHKATQRLSWHARLIGLTVFVLIAAPKTRIVVSSAPLYLLDGLIAVLLVSAYKRPDINWKMLHPIPKLVVIYIVFVLLGELHGLFEYMTPAKSIYLMARFSLAASLVYILPKLVTTYDDLIPVIKGVIVGILITSAIVMMYSISLTRPLVTSTIFSINILEPASHSVIREAMTFGLRDVAMRGRSLIGTSTLTTGFIGAMWPLVLLANKFPHFNQRWKRMALLAAFASPIALLMTYGRIAWLTVAAVGIMMSFFNFGGGRRVFAIMAICCLLIIHTYGVHSNLFQINRIMDIRSERFEISASERIQSYFEPFQHLAENPSWLFIGGGEIANKLIIRGHDVIMLYDRSFLSTHSAFSMAYYNYGLLAAMCMVLLMLSGFRLTIQKVKLIGRRKKEYVWIWQILLMALCGLTPWWLGGHAVVSAPRGAILFFFLLGLLLAFDRLQSQNASYTEHGAERTAIARCSVPL